MDEAISKLGEAEPHRAVQTLEAVRREIGARGSDAFLNTRALLAALARRVAPGNSRVTHSDDATVALLAVVGDLAAAMDADALGGAAGVLADAVPLLAKEKPRRAAQAAIAALARKVPASAARVAEAIIERGLRGESVRGGGGRARRAEPAKES